MLLLSTADYMYIKNHFFSKNSFWNTFRVSNGLDPDQDRRFVGPDQGPNCLQRLPAANAAFGLCRVKFRFTLYI